MNATEIIVLAGAVVSVVSSFTGIILDALRQKRESKSAEISDKLGMGQAGMERERLDMIDKTRAAIDNLGAYSDIDDRIRQSFRAELEASAARYERLYGEYESYRAGCKLAKQSISDTFDQVESIFLDKLSNGDKKELLRVLNGARREIDI